MSEVICYGSLLPDRVLQVPRFPRPGDGLHALSERVYVGGEPCNVGGHLAAWAVPVTLAGNNLGDDPAGAWLRAELARRPHTNVIVRNDPAVQTPTCYIWSTPDGERTMIPSWPTATGWTLPPAKCMAAARLVSVSIYGPGMAEMIALAQARHVPLAVADIAGPDDERLPGAAIVATSRAVLARTYAVTDSAGWLQAVAARSGALVIVSDGGNAAQAITPDGRRLCVQPPAITPLDTTGAGDALKAGLILGWLRGWPVERTLRFAIAAATLQCREAGPCAPASIATIEALLPDVQIS